MDKSATILYYSSNRELPDFERRVQENILRACGDLPIISVTQKPTSFGHNIVVGDDVGVSGFNMFRQVLIGCNAATTQFVISAEADCLYPPDYFTFRPEYDNLCYRNTNVWVMPQWRPFFWHKPEGATHAQIINREFYIQRLEYLFRGAPMWSADERNFPRERGFGVDIFPADQIGFYESSNPVVQIKTNKSMRHYTHSERIDTHELPYWGSGKAFRELWIK